MMEKWPSLVAWTFVLKNVRTFLKSHMHISYAPIITVYWFNNINILFKMNLNPCYTRAAFSRRSGSSPVRRAERQHRRGIAEALLWNAVESRRTPSDGVCVLLQIKTPVTLTAIRRVPTAFSLFFLERGEITVQNATIKNLLAFVRRSWRLHGDHSATARRLHCDCLRSMGDCTAF
jgi:hypothetical protein